MLMEMKELDRGMLEEDMVGLCERGYGMI